MKRILFLTIYYEPDLGAGSFRSVQLVDELSIKLEGIGLVHVITSMPSRYGSFTEDAPKHEEKGNVVVDRILLGKHKSGFLDQALAYRHYFFGVQKLVSGLNYDLVFVTSQRLFTSYLGQVIAKKNNCPLYVDVRDLFKENISEVVKNKLFVNFFKPILSWVEKSVFLHAKHINLVSEGFKENFREFIKPNYTYFTNGIDELFLSIEKSDKIVNDQIVITYAGNIGEGQGLEKILPQLAFQLGSKYLFIIIGDGGTKKALADKIKELQLSNVILKDPVKRVDLLQYYHNTDYLLLHLNNYKAFEKVLPSKLFEYGATNIPILAGISGYSAQFAKENLSNTFVFNPCDTDSLIAYLKNNVYKLERREGFVKKYRRKQISEEMANSILSYLD